MGGSLEGRLLVRSFHLDYIQYFRPIKTAAFKKCLFFLSINILRKVEKVSFVFNRGGGVPVDDGANNRPSTSSSWAPRQPRNWGLLS